MKKTKLFTSLAALALVLSLGSCDEIISDLTSEDTEVVETTTDTESGDAGETTDSGSESGGNESSNPGENPGGDDSSNPGENPGGDDSSNPGEDPNPGTGDSSGSTEPTTLSNYTLSIGITYNGQLEAVPEYATAYIQGSWDTWTNWVALTPSSGRYEYTFETIDVDTYQYQLVLAYNDQEPVWTYRITQDGANASFTVKGSDGDSYKNEVTVTASKALSEIIPDPNAAISDVTLTIDITYNGTSQGVLDYGTLWIQGGWDSWASWVACTVEDDKYVATFDSLSPIEYEFVGVIYYTGEDLPDETTLWDYKVNGTTNAKFTVDSNAVSTTLVATKALSDILPEKVEEELPTTYKLGCLDSTNYCYRYFSGAASGNFLATTTDWDQAANVYITAVDDNTENTCTLSFIDASGNTKYIYHSGGSETNVSIKSEPSTWVWTGEEKGFVDQTSNRYLCLYSDSFRAYAQSNNNAPALPYTTQPEDPEKPELTETFEQVMSLISGEEYYLGSYSDDTVHFITGATSSYQLATTTDVTQAVAVTATGDDSNGWKLTLPNGSYIYMYLYSGSLEFGTSSNTTVPNSGVNVFSWSSNSATLYTSEIKRTYNGTTYNYSYFEYYNSLVQGYGANSLTFSNAAHFYQAVTA